jgi:4-hydroxy-2-oxoheptanedioate aldolase
MRKNALKEKLYAGKAAFGVMVTFPSPQVLEMLGYLGFDWVLLDNEHGSITVDCAEECIRACEVSGVTPIVRPVGNRPDLISPFLDRGAQGVQVPHINTAEEARAVVDAVKFYPEGHRGFFFRSRPNAYGFAAPASQFTQEANRETLVCVMIEEVEGLRNLEEMLKVDGVDVYFIGSGDLSQSMGYPGQQTHPQVLRAMEEGIGKIRAAGKIAGVSCPEDFVPHFLGLGVQYFHTSVQQLLVSAGRPYLERMQEAASKAGL